MSKRTPRRNRKHGVLPKLAAQLAGCELTTVYKVLAGRTKSAAIERAIEEATRQLGRGARENAA